MEKGIYAGSFDPSTEWHIDIIERAAKHAQELVVWIWVNPDKNYIFSLIEREVQLKKALQHIPNVRVDSFHWLLVKYAYENWIWVIIRWIRNTIDFSEEVNLALINESQKLWVETFFIPTKNDKSHISSSAAKAIQKEHWDIHEYVPVSVKQALEARMSGQFFIWATWPSWAWKSYISDKIANLAIEDWIPTTNIELDTIWHEILWELNLPAYVEVRRCIAEEFWNDVMNDDWTIDRKALWPKIFWHPEKIKRLNSIMLTPMITRLRDKIYWKKWLFILDAALIAEFWWGYLCNNNILLVDSKKKSVEHRLSSRDSLQAEQIKRRSESQMTAQTKKEALLKAIEEDRNWRIIETDNTDWIKDPEIRTLLEDILKTVDIYWELRICRLLKSIWIKNEKEVYESIRKSYSSNERFYHDVDHLIFWLEHFLTLKDHIPNFNQVIIAWLFHDVIYETRKAWSEEASAELAYSFCIDNNLWQEFAEDVKRIILSTKHLAMPQELDEQYLVDIDLAILWQSWEVFEEYEANIRKEYHWVTDKAWREWRADVLQGFLDREHIYSTKYFRDKYEKQAEANLKKSIQLLKT